MTLQFEPEDLVEVKKMAECHPACILEVWRSGQGTHWIVRHAPDKQSYNPEAEFYIDDVDMKTNRHIDQWVAGKLREHHQYWEGNR